MNTHNLFSTYFSEQLIDNNLENFMVYYFLHEFNEEGLSIKCSLEKLAISKSQEEKIYSDFLNSHIFIKRDPKWAPNAIPAFSMRKV